MSICVNAHCLMLEVLRYIALNALNTVQMIKAMLKIDKLHIRGVMLCMLRMSEMLKIYKHGFAHNLINIQWIFNQEKVLKS